MKLSVLAALGLASTLTGCSGDEAGLERARLQIEVSDEIGRRSAIVACEALPLLQGSRRYTSHVIDDSLTIRVIAEPADVTLRFEDVEGKTMSKPLSVPRDALLNDNLPEPFEVTSGDGTVYTLTLSGDCTP